MVTAVGVVAGCGTVPVLTGALEGIPALFAGTTLWALKSAGFAVAAIAGLPLFTEAKSW